MAKELANFLFLPCLLVLALGLTACAPPSAPVQTPTVAWSVTPLPTPMLAGKMSLEEALLRRRSIREFSDAPLTGADLGQLLWATQGITSERGFRTAPSAGALYPLEVYVATLDGVFHYDPRAHALSVMGQKDIRQALYEAALRQESVRQAPAILVVAAVYERTAQKYGAERSPRYVHLEAGHAAQNLLLEVVALGLGSVPIGAFQDEQIQRAMGIPAAHQPLYLIPVGHPVDSGR